MYIATVPCVDLLTSYHCVSLLLICPGAPVNRSN